MTESLMALLLRAQGLRGQKAGEELPSKTAASRAVLEAPLNIVGMLVDRLLRLAPSDFVMRMHDAVISAQAGGRTYPFDPAAPAVEQARRLAQDLARRTGKEPALLALFSHAPVTRDLHHLNLELARHSLWALRSIRARPCRPQLVVAVDPYALDTVSLTLECLYAGVMGHYHVGLDRMAQGRGAPSSWLMGPTAWQRMPWRLVRALAGGGEVAMALSGGIEVTSRLLYALREALQDARRRSPRRGEPAQVLAALRREPDFAEFERGERLPVRRSAWRLMELWALSAACGVRGGDPAGAACVVTGRLEPQARRVIDACLGALGYEGAALDAARAPIASELGRETSSRARLLRILALRSAGRGRPVVVLPVVHRADPPGLEIKSPWAWVSAGGGRVETLRPPAGERWETEIDDFSRTFVYSNFS